MLRTRDGISKFTPADVGTWYRPGPRRIHLGDVLDAGNSDSMTVGFATYAPGESNDWVVTYDEALIVTRGSFTVTAEDGRETTARAGELIFIRNGTPVVYSAKDEGADLVYVTYPHWAEVEAARAAFADKFQSTEEALPATDAVSLLRSIFDPLERGDSDDFGRFYDAFADDIVFNNSIGEIHGKQALIDYLTGEAEMVGYDIFVRPLEYYGAGNRAVQAGGEVFTVKATGETYEADWAWVFDVEDGRITRILAIQDLSGIADEVSTAMNRARKQAA
jgi:ethanolamine utilization protein EutQ